MTVVAMPGFPATQHVGEYCVAGAQDKIVYPGIQQCISVTGFSVFGLLGTHISPGASEADIAKTFEILRSGGAANYPMWYVVGNFDEHFNHTKVGWNSTARIVKAMRKNVAGSATWQVCDTSRLASEFSFGIDIHATRGTFGVSFAYAKAFSRNAPVQPIAEPFLRA